MIQNLHGAAGSGTLMFMVNEERNKHEFFMRKCIDLALIAKSKGDRPIASIIIRNEKIITEAVEGGKVYKDITYHAEIVAIRQAIRLLDVQDLSDCTMYTTHEPCIMCSYVIRHTGISQIVIGATTGEIGGVSSQLPLLLDTSIKRWRKPPDIICGILENECREL
ncbi:MAG: nucleoside deaminase [Ginsengibacter sp.]